VQQDLLAAPTSSAPTMTVREQVSMPTPAGNGAQSQSQMDLGWVSNEAFMGTCPDCGSQLEFAEGCVKCHVCGFSECG
jgi:ribonucleoside-diphosphate reductase alpha chain